MLKPAEKLFPGRPFIHLALLLSVLLFLLSVGESGAQEEESRPYYQVQEGDSLWDIARRFGVSVDQLQFQNEINDPAQLFVGMRLDIPDLFGFSGRVDTLQIQFGDTLSSLSRKFGVSEDVIIQLNRLISPTQLIAGTSIIVPYEEFSIPMHTRIDLDPGQSFLELAVLSDKNPWLLMLENNLVNSSSVIPGRPLMSKVLPTLSFDSVPGGLPAAIDQIEISPLPLFQGNTLVVILQLQPGLEVRGLFAGRALNFFPSADGYVAMQGIHTLTEPGGYTLSLEGFSSNGSVFRYAQQVLVRSTVYIFDPMLFVPPETVDPTVTEPEDHLWESLGASVTSEKFWNGRFLSPVPSDFTGCWTSFFGNRRAYNGSGYDYYHSGLDFCGRIGTELYAPAAGRVVYTDSLVVRGSVVVIDHGWGVHSAYDHLSEILVKPGDFVEPGQVIGLGGDTGRTTGPHLHWEVWVGGVQVDPVDWLQQEFP